MATFADWSTAAGSNNTTSGVNIAEGCAPGNLNDACRAIMAQLRSAIDPAWASILSQSSLATIQTALGIVGGGSDSLDALAALTNAANKLAYMTGGDAWATTDFTSFGRTLVATGDAAAARTALAAIGGVTASFGTNTVSISIPLGTGDTLLIQSGTGTLAGDTSDTITFPTAYSVAPVCIVTGGSSNVGHEGDVHSVGTASTTGQAITNSNGSATVTYSWRAEGKA